MALESLGRVQSGLSEGRGFDSVFDTLRIEDNKKKNDNEAEFDWRRGIVAKVKLTSSSHT